MVNKKRNIPILDQFSYGLECGHKGGAKQINKN